MRPAGRSNNQVRPVTLTRNYTKHAEGSVLVEFGDTKVLCTASIEEGVPRFLKGQGQGWITAEYGTSIYFVRYGDIQNSHYLSQNRYTQ